MTKHKIGMVSINTQHLVIVIFSSKNENLWIDRYLFRVVSGNRYLPRGRKENILSTTITEHSYVQIGSASSNYTTFGFWQD